MGFKRFLGSLMLSIRHIMCVDIQINLGHSLDNNYNVSHIFLTVSVSYYKYNNHPTSTL